jgi:hypothetical protein
MKTNEKTYLELNCLCGIECELSWPQWSCYDTVTCEGSSFEELCESAGGFTVDQDGGELHEFTYEDLPRNLRFIVRKSIEAELMRLAAAYENKLKMEREQVGRENETIRSLNKEDL